MKYNLLILLSVCISGIQVNAQDAFTLSNGEEMVSKVLEVGSKEIKYKKHCTLDGPTYSISINEIFMVKYENGSKDVFGKSKSDETLDNKTYTDPLKIYFRTFGTKYYKGKEKLDNILEVKRTDEV